MGSGKGKTRRVQASVSAAKTRKTPTISEGKRKWGEFTRDSGMEKVVMHEYYLGRPFGNSIGAKQVAADAKKEVAELFADMAAVGALYFPGSLSAEDFEFAVGNAPGQNARMGLKSNPGITTVLPPPSQYLYPNVLMDSPHVYSYLEAFQDSIDILADQPKRPRAS
jgi:hypothetical protein